MPIPMTTWFARGVIYWLLMLTPLWLALACQHGLLHVNRKLNDFIEGSTALLMLPALIFTIMPALGWFSYLLPLSPCYSYHHGKPTIKDVSTVSNHIYGSIPLKNHNSMSYAIGVLEPLIGIMLIIIVFMVIHIRTTRAYDDACYE